MDMWYIEKRAEGSCWGPTKVADWSARKRFK